MPFSYDEMVQRNIGFVTPQEQARLRQATVFVCGTGGMGGACLMSLARIGVGRFVIADIDDFEVSNMNRQVFATRATIGRHKAEASRDGILDINRDAEVIVFRDNWCEHVAASIAASAVVVNGTDDLGASLLLYRTARAGGRSVIDAYASPLPSVYVTGPGDRPHEERMGYSTVGTDWQKLSAAQRSQAFLLEAEYVVIHSSSRKYIDLDLVGEVVAGRRSRMSFAPMVLTTGQLMAYEAVNAILGRPRGADNRGWFFNPYKARVERPKPAFIAALIRPVVRRYLRGLIA